MMGILEEKLNVELAEIKALIESQGVEVQNNEELIMIAVSDFHRALGLNKKATSQPTKVNEVTTCIK